MECINHLETAAVDVENLRSHLTCLQQTVVRLLIQALLRSLLCGA